jgi:hypothetical protein
METMTHHWRAEIATERQSPFRPHQCLAAPDLFMDTMLDWRIGETLPIDCTESLGNKYGSGSQTCRPKGKTYRDAHLRELVHSVAVEHVSEDIVICGSKPIGEKCGEGETTTE